MSKIRLILTLLLIDNCLCYIVMGYIPLWVYLEIVDMLERKNSGSMYSTQGFVIIVVLSLLLFFLLFLLDAIITSVVISRNRKRKYYRTIVILIITTCINAYYIFTLYVYDVQLSNDLKFVEIQSMIGQIAITILVLLAYKYIHKKLLGNDEHSYKT